MKHLSRGLAIALTGLYGLSALPFLFAALLPLSSALSQPANERASTPLLLVASMLFLAMSALLLAAAIGLFKEKKWSRWPFLLVSLLALALLAQTAPIASSIVAQFRTPPSGPYVIFTEGDALTNLERFVMPSLWVFLFTAAATAFVFHRTK
jgi:hypothetical protein